MSKCLNFRCYTNSSNDDKNTSLNACLLKCSSPCEYWRYELLTDKLANGAQNKSLNTLIAPLNDYTDFVQRPSYTWFKVVADFGGLL